MRTNVNLKCTVTAESFVTVATFMFEERILWGGGVIPTL